MTGKIYNHSQKAIEGSFYLLFFLVPLILSPWNFELFEFNKMMLTYILTVVIAFFWILRQLYEKRLIWRKTPLDLPLLLFLSGQILSTVFSWDRHVSIFGYYSRFNGGLLSSIAYLTLFYAFVANFPKQKIKKLINITLFSALVVSVYGILEHFGIDKDIWVQDVENRVFSTLGQPNWLAAYLAVLIPISLSISLKNRLNLKYYLYSALSLIFFITLIFSKSRSGFLSFVISDIIFSLLYLWKAGKKQLSTLLTLNLFFLIIIFLLGAPFAQINRFSLSEIGKQKDIYFARVTPAAGTSIIDVGITESAEIRNIVWKGAVDIFKNYPLLGTGVETFAFAYYKFRPLEHNNTSEWDFLYNKAHNEYLNYAATTGILGLGSYLLIIAVFIIHFLKKNLSGDKSGLQIGLFSGFLTILITNFFGFSVVIIQLFFFLIPAMFFLEEDINEQNREKPLKNLPFQSLRKWPIYLLTVVSGFLILRCIQLWSADVFYARGHSQISAQDFSPAYRNLSRALNINQNEPVYLDDLAIAASQLAVNLAVNNEATMAAEFARQAMAATEKATAISPNNVLFWKTKTRVFYSLFQLDENYIYPAVTALEQAMVLAPTDPKIRYNLALLYDQLNKTEEAYRLLNETVKLKIDYRDAYLALGVFYSRDKDVEMARKNFEFILKRLNPNDSEAKEQLEKLKS